MSRPARSTPTKGRGCDGKTRHPSKAAAEKYLTYLVRNGADRAGLNVYECAHCRDTGGGWHVGHKPGNTRRR